MTLCGVYQIKSLRTGRLYIGSSENLIERLAKHRRLLKRGVHHSYKLQREVSLHGIDVLEFKPLVICAPKDLLFFEQRLIQGFNTVKRGFNVAEVAGAPMRGRKHTDATKRKMSAASKGKPKTAEHAANISKGKRGKAMPEQHRVRVRAAWVTRRLVPVSEETRKKLAEAGKGRPVAEVSRLALIAWNKSWKGKKRGPMVLTDEERQRRIDANKARKGQALRAEIQDDVRGKKQAAWAARKAAGLHTRRWYVNRGIPVPWETPTMEPTTDGDTFPPSPSEE